MHDTAIAVKPRRHFGAFVVCLALLGGFFGAKSADAQTFTLNPVNALVPNPSGGSGTSTDTASAAGEESDAVYNVTLTGAAANTTYTITVQTVERTAFGENNPPTGFYPNDFVNQTQTLTFTGNATQTFTVNVIDELDFEDRGAIINDFNKQFFDVRIVAPSASAGTVTADPNRDTSRHYIIDNDVRPDIRVVETGFIEGAAGTQSTASVTFQLSARNEVESVPFNYSFDSGAGASTASATEGQDFADSPPNSNSATFNTVVFGPTPPAGSTPAQFQITVPGLVINGDNIDELDESVLVQITNAQNVRVPNVTGNVNILDDDAPRATISDASVTEGDSGQLSATFTVTLSNPSIQTININYTVAPGGPGDPAEEQNSPNPFPNRGFDYIDPNNDNNASTFDTGTITFGPNTTSQTITIPILGDVTDENDETFTVTVFSGVNTRGVTFVDTAGNPDNQGIGTIFDNDQPTFTISNTVSTTEPGTANFTIDLAQASERTITVVASTQDGTAVAPGDYQSKSQTLTFLPGNPTDAGDPPQTSKTFSVTVNDDTIDEIDETFFVNLSNANVADAQFVNGGQAVATIIDNDGPQISITDVTQLEGNSGVTPFVFTVTLTNPTTTPVNTSPQTVTVNFTTQDGTATSIGAAPDFTATSGILTFMPGESSKTITVNVIGDLTYENLGAAETFSVILSGATNANSTTPFLDTTGVGTIQSNNTTDDPQPTVSVTNPQVVEGAPAAFIISLSNPADRAITVSYSTSNGTAITPTDYASTTGNVTFSPASANAPAETSKTVNVATASDTQDETNETFFLTVGVVSGPATAPAAPATATIIDDDGPSITITDVTVSESAGNATINLSLNVASPQTVTVTYATANGTATAGKDYTSTSGTVTFTPGATTGTITVPILNDVFDEANETFVVNLSAPTNATISDNQATVTITDDDLPPTVSINSPVTVAEGNTGTTNATFTVTLSAAAEQSVTVNFTTANGTATGGSDFTSVTNGTVTFAPGETSKTFTVAIIGDTTDEAAETFTVTLSSPTNATLSAQTVSTVTITNDDSVPSVSINSTQVVETDGGAVNATFTVSLSAASGKTVTVNFATSNGSATAPADYQSTSGMLTFAPGETSKSVTVSVQGDDIDEDDETFFVDLSGATNTVIGAGQGVGTIVDNDGPEPDVTIGNVTLTEGDSGTVSANFTVRLSSASLETVTVDYTTVNGTATAGTDFTATSGTLTFLPGELSKLVTVAVTGDTFDEANETFIVRLSNTVNGRFPNGQTDATATITDDDAATLTLTLSANTVAEGGTVTGTVSRNTPTTADLVVTLSSSDASEATVPTQVTIPAGSTSVSFTITGQVEEVVDGAQTIIISASAAGFVAATAQLTVTDVIPARLTLTINPSLIREGGNPVAATATISRNVAFDTDLVVTLSNSRPNRVTVPGSVTIPAGSSSATFIIRAINDDIASGSQAVSITAQANAFSPATAGITVIDNDEAGIIVTTPSGGLRTTEEGGTATFTIKLKSRPLSNVTIDLQLDLRRTEVRLPLTSITIKPEQFATERVVTVVGVNDKEVDGDQRVIVSTRPAQSTDPAYSGINPADVIVVNADNEVPGFNVSPLTLRTTEAISGRSQATFAISLKASPVAGTSVFIGLTSGDPSEGKVSPESIRFTSTNFSTPQIVRVTAIDDRVADNDVTYRIITSPASAPGTPYNGLNPPDVTVTNEDNDDNTVPRVVITSPTAGASVRSITTFTGTATDPGPATIARVFGILFRTLPSGRREFFSANGVASSTEQRLTVSGIERFRILLSLPPGRTLPAGRYTLEVTAIDTAGNQGKSSVTFIVNNQPPVIAITSPRTGSIAGDVSTISGTVRPAEGLGTIAGVSVVIKRGTTIVKSLAATVSGDRFTSAAVGTLADGSYTAEATARDSAGNTATATSSFTLDRSAPTGVTITSPTNGTVVGNIRVITGTAGDAGTGLSRVELIIRRRSDDTYFNGSAFVPRPIGTNGVPGAEPTVRATLSGNTFSYTLPNGLPADPDPLNAAYTITAIALDTAGNKTSSSQVTVRLGADGDDGGGTVTPGTSNVRLSSVSVKASDASIVLAFNGNLDGDVARDPSLYTVTVNGQAVAIESVSFRAVDGVVVITLNDGAIRIGDAVSVRFTNLRDAAGLVVAGQATVTTR